MKLRLALLLLLALAGPAGADEKIVLGLSQNSVTISTNFDGENILIFGAVNRDSPPPRDSLMGVIITVAGPESPLTVRQKEHRFGIWINTNSVHVDSAPSYYAVATTAPLSLILKEIEDVRYKISIPRAIRQVGALVTNSQDYTEALIRIRQKSGLYQVLQGSVTLDQNTLFGTRIPMPSNLVEGDYKTRIFLTRNGQVIDEYDTTIPVYKVGLERWLYNLAHQHAYLYGALSLVIAVLAGYGASAIFERLRR
ncbi:MAG: hypothetical protein GC146_10840 [Limimaricola sp.]|uniref:TIGR02186 family protein n=1 Tax=Limimaricola sp. TaxID=2211665 RepID=UPI001D853708|nr:TIGR02186 family protein [Limimaricola sp.]MBI1417707.1 hypothetical protein [Limimaricola sp.]